MSRARSAEEQFAGTERFVVKERLGAGGMGIVYRAYDRERDTHVALKLLRNVDPHTIFRFKQEFRSLTDVTHRNLATLYELVSHNQHWFFTMELVDGGDFLDYVRGPGTATRAHSGRATPPVDSTADTRAAGAPTPLSQATTRPERPNTAALRKKYSPGPPLADPEQFARLRDGLRQLAHGVQALHDAGHLHRDIKPSNILVDRDGRVVLLDFGVVTELASRASHDKGRLVGTPAYMAPEQAAALELTPASDWYAVGVVLYEALAGRRPYPGDTETTLKNRQRRDAPTLRGRDVPQDLVEACERLMARDPVARITGAELLGLLGEQQPRRSRGILAAAPPEQTVPVGRDRQLSALHRAYAEVCAGGPRSVFVSGASGSGKSTLCNYFLAQVRETGDAFALAGRCYEQESVPYKALDSLIDELCRLLVDMPADQLRELIPHNASALARLFPVLNRIEAVAATAEHAPAARDPHEIKRRGFTALRRLLTRLAERRPLVLCVDDVQWADAESAELLAEVLRPPDPPVMLLLGSLRLEGLDGELVRTVRSLARDDSVVDLSLAGLDPDDALVLAESLLAGDGADDDTARRARAIAVESSGNPFFITELARYARASSAAAEPRLDGLIRSRTRELDTDARQLLEVIAVAGRPVQHHAAKLAANLDEAAESSFALLRRSHLIRSASSHTDELVETYHDRIRESVVAQLDPHALRGCHLRLAEALESCAADAETLAAHFLAAGEDARAAYYCEAAARHAAETLAFDRAVALYRRAVALRPQPSSDLLMALAEALANAGRGREAADAYLRAAAGTDTDTQLRCKRSAADQLMRSGYVDRATEVLADVLDHVGVRMPATPRRAVLSAALRRVQLKLRGLRWRERPDRPMSADDLLRLEVFEAVAKCFAVIDTVRGADFQARGILLALRSGRPERVAGALCLEAGYASTQGHHRRAQEVIEQALRLARDTGDIHHLALATTVDGLASYFRCDYQRATERLAEAEQLFLDHTTGTLWEVNTGRLARLWSLRLMGAYRPMRQLHDRYLRDARRRGDRYVETTIRRLGNELWLARDDVAGARKSLAKATWTPPEGAFHLQHWYELRAHAEVNLYAGDTERALTETEPRLNQLSRSLLLRVQMVRAESRWLHARLLLASPAAPDRRVLRQVDRIITQLDKEELACADAWARFLAAAVAAQRGRHDAAADKLAAAASIADGVDMELFAAFARRARGQLVGDTAQRDRAQSWLGRAGIRDAGAMARALVPACVTR